MVSPQNQNPIVAIENIVLPSDFSVEVASKNVRTIRMFEDDQQMKLTSEYLKYIQQSRVLPNSTNKDKWTVDVCVSKPRKMKVFIKKSRNLSSNFTKAYRSNRVLTPLTDIIKQHAPSNAKAKPPNNGGKKTRNPRVARDADKLTALGNRMRTNKELITLNNKLTKDNDMIYQVTVKFKMLHVDKKKKKMWYWVTFRTTFTAPVLRAFQEFSTSVVEQEVVYTFFDEDEDFEDVKDPYAPITRFLEFIDHHVEQKSKTNTQTKHHLMRKKHTPNADHRQLLSEFVEQLDKFQYINSHNLMEIRLTSDVPFVDTDESTSPGLADSVVALGGEFTSTYIDSEFFEGSLLKMDDSQIVRTDSEYPKDFEKFTASKYRPNSCLATCALHHMYHTTGKNFGKVKWWKDKSMKTYPPPTYDTISKLCGIPFGDDGSLRLSLNQFKPFLEKYSMRCFAITPRATLVFKHLPSFDNMTKPLGLTGLKLIISHNHVNLIPTTLATKFAKFIDSDPVKSDSPKTLVHEYYQVATAKPNASSSFARFPIRRNFDPPLGVSIDRNITNIEADAQKMVDVLMKMVWNQQNAKVKSKQFKQVRATYHYCGDFVRIAYELKNKHNLVVNQLRLSGRHSDEVKAFSVVYKAHYIDARLVIGKIMEIQVLESDVDVVSQTLTHEGFDSYNAEYQLFYTKLYNKANMSTYSKSLSHELRTYTCAPPSFGKGFGMEDLCIGGIDKNKAYASNMLEMDRVPIFSPFSEMERFDHPLYMNKDNAYKLSDFAIYKVQTETLDETDIARYLIFDKKIVLYYGKYLRQVLQLLPVVKFKITAFIEPYKTNTIDWSGDLKRLYANERLTNDQKKLIPNTLLGCLDKYQSEEFIADCFFSRTEANNMFNANEGISRVKVRSNLADVTWDECEAQVEDELMGEMDNLAHDCVYDEFGHQMTSPYSNRKWELTNNRYQRKKPTLHVNVYSKSTSTFDQGFLPISLMKYNHNRIAVLKMWLRIIDSGTLIPIAVKTDCVFVADSNFENYRWLSERMNLPPNTDYDKILNAEQEQKDEQERVETASRKAFNEQMSPPLTNAEKEKMYPWLLNAS